ncbi:MAG: hypothetical protein WC100_20975 [Sterolibacterium sp.]
MVWEVHEKADDKDGVKEWSLYVVFVWNDEEPKINGRPIEHGYWFLGKDGGDPAGERFYQEGWKIAKSEAERLNRLGKRPGR